METSLRELILNIITGFNLFRDLRCEKIIYLNHENKKIKIVDNGSSRPYTGSFTSEEVQEFQPKDQLYLAPEIVQNRFSEKSLTWSVGMILYFMISGKFPYDGPQDVRIEKKLPIFGEGIWYLMND